MFNRGEQFWHKHLAKDPTWKDLKRLTDTFNGLEYSETEEALAMLALKTWNNWHLNRKLPGEYDILACLWLHVCQHEEIGDDPVADLVLLNYAQKLVRGLRLIAAIETRLPEPFSPKTDWHWWNLVQQDKDFTYGEQRLDYEEE